jgi:hypothetical protein
MGKRPAEAEDRTMKMPTVYASLAYPKNSAQD